MIMLISVVVNCYNRADMVCTALDSVWNQTYRPIELIIVDDGSKDNTFDVVQEWVKNHPDTEGFSTIARTFPNGKLCVARNRGLELAHGDYIQYVDDDDWLYPEAIKTKAEKLQKESRIDLLVNQLDYICEGRKINETHISLPVITDKDNMLLHLLTHECMISAVLMFRTETLRRIGAWTPGLVFADDMEITCRLAIEGGKFAIVERNLSGYRIHGSIRQCTTVREKLPYDFCPKLFFGLYSLARKQGLDSEEIRSAFASKLREDAMDFIHIGRFDSAYYCLASADAIKERKQELPLFTIPIRYPLTWHLRRSFWQLRGFLKSFLKFVVKLSRIMT